MQNLHIEGTRASRAGIHRSHITERRVYKHEKIARHVTPTDRPEKTWCTFFFDEEPHFCHIMRQGGV